MQLKREGEFLDYPASHQKPTGLWLQRRSACRLRLAGACLHPGCSSVGVAFRTLRTVICTVTVM